MTLHKMPIIFLLARQEISQSITTFTTHLDQPIN